MTERSCSGLLFTLSLALAADGARPQAATWTRVRYPREVTAPVFDAARGRAVMLLDRETWEWTGSHWVRRDPLRTPNVTGAILAYDPRNRRTVFLGTGPGGPQTWLWNGDDWHLAAPTASPPGTGQAVWDGRRQRLVLWPAAAPGTAWDWDGTDWSPSPIPAPPRPGALAFDPARQRIVLYWADPAAANPETWEWDGTAWQQAMPQNHPHRARACLAHDLTRQRTVLFGGMVPGSPLFSAEVWEWDGNDWTQATAPTAPAPRIDARMVYDTVRQEVLVAGGTTQHPANAGQWLDVPDTWSWDGTSWRQTGSRMQPGRDAAPIGSVFDPTRDRVVLIAAGDATEVWEFMDTFWRLRADSGGPAPAPGAALAFDSARQRVLWGGAGALGFETWLLDRTNTWTPQAPALRPTARSGHALAGDAARQRVVLFGGEDAAGPLADTWEWDGSSWLAQAPAIAPPPRTGHGMAWDSARRRTVLFGGRGAAPGAFLADTWEWNGAGWTAVAPTLRPAPRVVFNMTYDEDRQRTVLLGGLVGPASGVDDLWFWDGASWTPGPAPGGFAGTVAWDGRRRQLVAFGGDNGTGTFGPQAAAVSETFGSGCPGARGTPILTSSAPYLGNGGFAFEILDAAPDAPVAIAIGMTQVHLPLGSSGCAVLIDAPVYLRLDMTSPDGTLDWPVPLPWDPVMRGTQCFAQAGIFDLQGSYDRTALTAGRRLVAYD